MNKLCLFILSILFCTSFVFGTENDDSGYQTGQAIAIFLFIYGAIKCFMLARKKKTSTLCMLSLGLVFTGVVSTNVLLYFSKNGFDTVLLNLVGGIIIGAIFIASLILGIVGLSLYENKYDQGKNQAIWGIILSVFFLILFVYGAVQGLNKNKDINKKMEDNLLVKGDKPDVIINTKDNFKIIRPKKRFKEINLKKMNPAATIAFVSNIPQTYYILISEVAGIDLETDSKALAEIAKNNIEASLQNGKFSETVPLIINGMEGYSFQSDGIVSNLEISYMHWVYSHNGYFYQHLVWSDKLNRNSLPSDLKELVSNFSQIDPTKTIYSAGTIPSGNYVSKEWGYTFNFDGQPWLMVPKLDEKITGADYGVMKSSESAVIYINGIIKDKAVNHSFDSLKDALLLSLAINQNDEKFKFISKEIQENHAIHTYSTEISNILYLFKLYEFEDHVILMTIKLDKEYYKADEFFESIKGRIYIKSGLNHDFDTWGEKNKIALGRNINQLGIQYFRLSNFEIANHCFKEALKFATNDMDVLYNIMHVYDKLNKFQEAVTYYESFIGERKPTKEILSWYAYHLYKIKEYKKSDAQFKLIFKDGFKDTEKFEIYLKVLSEFGVDELNLAVNNYLKDEDNYEIRLLQSDSLFELEAYEKALEVLENLDENKQINSDVMIKKIYCFLELNKNKELIEMCDALIEKKNYIGDAHFYKGKAQYKLKWYSKAKTSFESALVLFPNDESIKAYIQSISGLLGQGKNTAVKTPIEAVIFPDTLKNKMSLTVDPKSIEGQIAYYPKLLYSLKKDSKGRWIKTTETYIKILNETGVNQFSTMTFSFNSLSESLYINSLVVKNEKGEIVGKGNIDEYYILDDSTQTLKTYEQVLNVPIPQLFPGCTIEVVSSLDMGKEESLSFQSNLLSGFFPIGSVGYAVYDEKNEIEFKLENGGSILSFDGGKGVLINEPPVYIYEDSQIPYYEYLPMLYINGKNNNWQEIGKHYLDKINDKLIATEDVSQLAKKITSDLKTSSEKVKSIFKYLQKNVTYQGLEFGSRGQIPNSSSQTINNRYGDCKDHAVLFHVMLNELGIKNHLVLVNSNEKIIENMPSIDQFNHVINYIEDESGGKFWDATDKCLGTSIKIPIGLGECKAFILDPKNIRFDKLDSYKENVSDFRIDRLVSVKGEKLLVSEKILLTKYYASFFRSYFQSQDQKTQLTWGKSVLSNIHPHGVVLEFDVIDVFENDKDLVVSIKYEISERIFNVKEGKLVNLPSLWEPYALRQTELKTRTSQFQKLYPLYITTNTTLNLESFKIGGELPAEVSDSLLFFDYNITYELDGNQIKIKSNFTSHSGKFKKEQFSQYVEKTNAYLKALTPSIIIK